MSVALQLAASPGTVPRVEYRWDEDTDILTATLADPPPGEGLSGSVGVEGRDGSWLVFDVASGAIRSVEVPVWPTVRRHAELVPPGDVEPARVLVPARRSQPGLASIEMNTTLIADADVAERTIHFRIGKARPVRTVRVARDILLDVDAADYLAGVWLLNVPPSPVDS